MATIAEMLIRLGMDASGLKQGAGQAKQELSGLEKSMKGVEQAGKTMTSIGTALTMGVTTPLIGASTAVASFVVGAEGMTKVRSAFDGIARSAGSSGDAVLLAMQKGSQGMMSNIDLMKNFNLASQLVSEDFAMKLPEAFGYLGKVSAATGESMDYMLNSLIKGVGRLSPLILDNLGIQVDMNAAYEAYGATLGKSVEEMTKAEKQTAILNATMTALAENTAAMPENFGSVTASLKATFQNAKDAIGETLLPVLGEVTSSLTGAINKIVEMTTEGGNLYPVLQKAGDGFSNLVNKVGDIVDKLSQLDPAWVKTIADVVGFVAVLGPALLVTGKLTTSIVGMGKALTSLMTTFGMTASAASAALGPIAIGLAAIGVEIVLLSKHNNDLAESTKKTNQGMAQLADAVRSGIIDMPTYNQLVADIDRGYISLDQALSSLPTKVSNVTNAQNDQIMAIFDASTSYKNYTEMMAAAGIEIGNVTEELYNSEKGFGQNSTAAAQSANSVTELLRVYGNGAVVVAQTAEELEQAALEMEVMNQIATEAAGIKSMTANFSGMISYAQNYDQIQKQINEKMTLMSQIDVNGDGIADVGNAAKGTQEDLDNLTAEVEALNGALETMAAQAALSMLQATIAIGGVTEAEAKLFFDTAVAMGQMTQAGADAAYQSYGDSIKLMNLLELDPKTGEISVDNYDAMMAILAIDDMTIAEKIAAIEAILSGEEAVKSTIDGLAKNRTATITVNAVAGNVTAMFRAEGGDVARKNVYIVGEKGPEIFVPNTDGQIIPNHKIGDYASSLNSGGAGSVVTNNYNLSMPTTANAGDVKMAFELMEAWGT